MTAQGFLSYAHSDDHFLDGGISWLRERLEVSIHAVSGRPFKIFQDKDGIEVGQRWPKRLNEALQDAQFLIPFLTPSFFSSSNCRAEVTRFLEYESAANRDDLILPIYLINIEEFENNSLQGNDALLTQLYERQHRDWRFCVHDIQGNKEINRHIFELAEDIGVAARTRVSFFKRELDSSTTSSEPPKAPIAQNQVESRSEEIPRDLAASRDDYWPILSKKAEVILTISRHRTFIGQDNADICRGMWGILEYLRRNVSSRNSDNITFVWVVDFGLRVVEEEHSFEAFVNVGQLAMNFHSFAMFETVSDHRSANVPGLMDKARITDSQKRMARWEWLASRSVIVAKNLRREEFDGLYPDDESTVNSIRVADTEVSSEHILPTIMPSIWAHQLQNRSKGYVEASDSTFTVVLGSEKEHANKDRRCWCQYFAHSSPPDDVTDREGQLWLGDSFELQSPGRSYDEAAEMTKLAAEYRLGLCDSEQSNDGATAVAYLNKLGFQVLRVSDFLRVFANSI